MRASKLCHLLTALLLLPAAPALAAQVTADFSTDLGGNLLENGRSVEGRDFGGFFTLSGSGKNEGPAIFDSTMTGPNASGDDPDLLVNQGNLLILQSPALPRQTVPGIFNVPNDSKYTGGLFFAFASPVALLSIGLVDHDPGDGTWVFTLTDAQNLTRIFPVPRGSTPEGGTGTLDFTTGGTTETGFDPDSVLRLEIFVRGSGGFDNLVFDTAQTPEPGALALLGLGVVALARTRARRAS